MSAPALGRPTYLLVRSEDQLDLKVEPVDLTLKPSGTGYVLQPGAAGGFLIVTLPAQHAMESAKTVETKGQPPAFGAPTRLVFEVDKTTPPIAFTVEGILDALPRLSLAVNGTVGSTSPLPAPAPVQPAAAVLAASAERRAAARVAGGTDEVPAITQERTSRSLARLPVELPDQDGAGTVQDREAAPADATADPAEGQVFTQNTSLRLPSRLELTPRGGATAFTHSAHAVTHDGRTEAWHTRLAQLRADNRLIEAPAELIALASYELPPDPLPADWAARVSDTRLGGALPESVRKDLVLQTPSRPLIADRLMLSGFGAWLDAQRDFNGSDHLVSYQHRMAMGRDILVRSVQLGRLYPFGHKAMLTITTERRFDPDNGQLAVLNTKQVITVREKTKNFSSGNRAWPWSSVTLLTRSTPGGETKFFAIGGAVLHVGGEPFAFRCLGVDRGGRSTTFEVPLVFVLDGMSLSPTVTEYRKPGRLPMRTVSLAGQTLSVAPPSADAPEATDVVTDEIVLNMTDDEDGIRAVTDSITGKLPSLQKFAPALADTNLPLNFATAYLDHAFSSNGNAGQLVLQLAGGQSLKLMDLADKAVTGGLASPKFTMNAISRLTGPVGGDLAALATGKVRLADLLKQTVGDVKVLGIFSLVDLVGADLELELAPTLTNAAKRVPTLITEAIDGVSVPRLHWELDLFKGPKPEVTAPNDPTVDAGPVSGTLSVIDGTTAKLIVDVTTELEQPVDPTHPKVHNTATCRVENVKLTMGMFGKKLVSVPFKHISFTSRDGRKPDFDVDLGAIEFFGVLAFVRSLAALIPADGFHDPPALDITDEKITSSFALPVPAVSAGAFSLENITFSAALDLWYAKPPELSLNFATFDNRFRLTVLCLGGGGYLGVGLSTRGLQRLDGALEFGAAVSVNLGVASGAVSVMGGVHFAYDHDEGGVVSGYVEVRGEIEVLCVLEVGVSLLVMLSYHFATGELAGEAQLEAHVKFLWFKKTVRVPFHYSFAGAGGGDGGDEQRAALPAAPPAAGMPGFLDQMAPRDWPAGQPTPWDTYCQAFA
jgi:hypothetical protein